jgi:hypothetical protein
MAIPKWPQAGNGLPEAEPMRAALRGYEKVRAAKQSMVAHELEQAGD